MATTIIMPQIGYDMREGTVVRWRKKEGDSVAKGDVLAEIETDKATVEMEAFSPGILGKIVAEEGRTVPVGDPIAVITDVGEAVPPLDQLTRAGEPAQKTAQLPAVTTPPPDSPGTSGGEIKASPIARRLAREKGIDLSSIPGTGPGGRITESDVQRYGDGPASVPSDEVGLGRMRRAIGRVTAQSKREIPHFYVSAEVDMAEAMSVRRQLNENMRDETRISINDLIVKAAALALIRHEKFNSSLKEEQLEVHQDLNIGIAVALEQGLIVPSSTRCQDRSLTDIAKASSDLIQRAQSNSLRVEEYGGSTFSISNLGMFDVDSFAAIILPPMRQSWLWAL